MAVSSVSIAKFSASIWFCILFYKLYVFYDKKHLRFSLKIFTECDLKFFVQAIAI